MIFGYDIIDYLLATALLGVVGLIIVLGQMLFIAHRIRGEYSRKFIHMTVALWMSTWRFLLPAPLVVGLCVVMGVIVYIAKKKQLLKSIFEVERTTHGEVTYALGVGIVALVFSSPHVFALAVLNLGFADGLAAIIGIKYGRRVYNIFGAQKTLAGALASFGFTFFSGSIFWSLAPVTYSPYFVMSHLLGTAVLISGIELIGRRGWDNVAIPVATALMYYKIIF